MKRSDLGVGRRTMLIILITFLIVCDISPVMAMGVNDIGVYTKGQQERSLLSDVDSVSDIRYKRVRNGHLNYGYVELQKVSPTRAGIIATTQAHHICPEIHMDIYVDKFDVNTQTWNQWRYWEYSTNSSQHLTKNMEIIVPSGYYYSVRGYHTCIHGNVMESAETMTDGLYIGTTDKPII